MTPPLDLAPDLAPDLAVWRERGRHLDVFGHRVFVLEDGPTDEVPIVVLHGFPTSSHDFAEALPHLSQDRAVVVLDFPGFGLSDKPADYSYSLLEQAEIAVEVWRTLGLTRAHLVAHDYGTSVATELLVRRQRRLLPFSFDTVTMCNGSMHIELAQVTVAQKIMEHEQAGPLLARFATAGFFKSRMRKIFGRPDALSEQRLDQMWAGIREQDGHQRLPAISQYLKERRRFWHRWIGALTELRTPTHVLWGRRDPIAVPAIAEQLAREVPDATVTWLDDLGHYPMIEDPARWSAKVVEFIRERG